MTPEDEARLVELEYVREHDYGCRCAGCEEWRCIKHPEYRNGSRTERPVALGTPMAATMGRRRLWATIRTHEPTCWCAWCSTWEDRWTKAEYDIDRLFPDTPDAVVS